MRRIRLSTLMLLIVIAALIVALVMERNRSARLERQVPQVVDIQAMLISRAKTKGKAVGGRQPAGVEAPGAKEEEAK
jgi:hypothetical protein